MKICTDPRWNELRERSCPGCLTLLKLEAVPPASRPPIHDFVPGLDGFHKHWPRQPLL
jgi:acetone carboxylase, gamma subunit